MNKSPVVRWLLLALGGVTLLMLYRVVSGPPARDGLVVIEDLEAYEIKYRALEVDHSIVVAIEGMGSFESADASATSLAAYAWITDRTNRDVVWKMDATENVQRGRGAEAIVQDTLRLPAGYYDVYFATYGNQLVSSNSRGLFGRTLTGVSDWQKDFRKWYVTATLIEGKETDARSVHRHEERTRFAEGERVVWDSGPVEDDEYETFLFRVNTEATVNIRTVGELGHDIGQVEDVLTGDIVWEMSQENSIHAGGAEQNRLAHASVELQPGIYRASYRTDATHAYSDWVANPPYDVAGWGLSLTVASNEPVPVALDVWNEREPAVSILRVENSQFKAVTFAVNAAERVLVYGLGEMKSNDRYDYGWIEQAVGVDPFAGRSDEDDFEPNRDLTIWEMTYDGSVAAGGDRSNRRVMSFVDLPPARYNLYYRTDESQAYDSWSNGEPNHGEQWGVAVFSIDDTNPNRISILDQATWEYEREDFEERISAEVETAVEAAVSEALEAVSEVTAEEVNERLGFDESDVLLAMNRLENNANVSGSFTLREKSRIRIVALGEITESGERYDFGSIEKANSGELVWDMTWENTVAAGGDDANRIFEGEIELPAGEYVVRFSTDGTHSFNHFDTRPPSTPAAWGITIATAQ